MSTAAIMHAAREAERRLVDALSRAGAIDPAGSQPLKDLRVLESRQLRHLLRACAVREVAAGRYYLDEPAYAAYRARRRSTVAAIVTLLAVGVGVGAWLLWAGGQL